MCCLHSPVFSVTVLILAATTECETPSTATETTLATSGTTTFISTAENVVTDYSNEMVCAEL